MKTGQCLQKWWSPYSQHHIHAFTFPFFTNTEHGFVHTAMKVTVPVREACDTIIHLQLDHIPLVNVQKY